MRRWYAQLLQLRFRLLQRRRYNALTLEYHDERPLIVLPQVLNPTLFAASKFFAHAVQADWFPPAAEVLELGTGSGIGAIYAAQHARSVVAVDLNPHAVRCAQINMLLNRVDDRVMVLGGDLFAPIGTRRFDVILFNPPFYHGRPRDELERAWRSEDVIERFAAELRQHLTERGCAYVLFSTVGDTLAFLRAFQAHSLQVEIAVQRDVLTEVLTIYRIK